MARPIVLIPHLFRLAGVIFFRKDYSPPLVRHLDPSTLPLTKPRPTFLGLRARWPSGNGAQWRNGSELKVKVVFLPFLF